MILFAASRSCLHNSLCSQANPSVRWLFRQSLTLSILGSFSITKILTDALLNNKCLLTFCHIIYFYGFAFIVSFTSQRTVCPSPLFFLCVCLTICFPFCCLIVFRSVFFFQCNTTVVLEFLA